MQSYVFTLVALLLSSLAFAESEPFSLVGKIGDKLSVVVTLRREGKGLTGSYHYNKPNAPIELKGQIEENGKFEMIESDGKGLKTGKWVGKWESKPSVRLFGQWINPKSGKTLPFNLSDASAQWGGRFQVKTLKKTEKKKGCEASSEYDELSGLTNESAMKVINAHLKKLGFVECGDRGNEDPDEPGRDELMATANVQGLKANRYLLVVATIWEYGTGAAHGSGSPKCLILDLQNGEVVGLKRFLTPAGSALVKKTIADDLYEGDQSNDFLSQFAISDDNICPKAHGLEFVFAPYQVASYADGEPSVPVAGNAWNKYFMVNEQTKAIFGE